MSPPDELTVLWCGNLDQHPGHVWSPLNDDADAWCYGANADGTSPYDPQRPGYEAPAPPPITDPMLRIDAIAREVQGHLTIHASYGPEAIRHPDPDWSCQLVWATGQPAEPIQAFFGTGSNITFAVAHVLAQIDEAIAALPDPQEDTP